MKVNMRVTQKQAASVRPDAKSVTIVLSPIDQSTGPATFQFTVDAKEEAKYPIWAEVAVDVPEAN